ncbi:MAG: hypothetical protein P8R42_22285 [Candidatus Binatia bacterium]|nr:hypothetical protein [Candidatus Binatia bacterium]
MQQVEQALQKAKAIFRFTEEVDRSLAEQGIAGLSDLFGLYAQFRDALGRLETRELDWASSEADRLSKSLNQICTELAHLSALKASLGVQH